MQYDDTNFIGIVNAREYNSFVDNDWSLEMLLKHFANEMKTGNILVCQMTEEGIEYSWNIEVNIGTELTEQKCFRKAVGYIKVTENLLYLVDYTCLTMSAQFEDEKIPDKNCLHYKIDIENGIYKVDIIQFYNVDKDEYIGNTEKDILLNFTKVSEFQQSLDKVAWCSY
jgi:hypothetical protein